MSTITKTVPTEDKLKNKAKELNIAVSGSSDLDTVLNNIKKVDNTCAFAKCKSKTADFAITCKFCNRRFCTSHGLPEIHGCGEAVRREERRKFVHPDIKFNQEKHEKASTKLSMKLKQMQLERKAKPGGSSNKKK